VKTSALTLFFLLSATAAKAEDFMPHAGDMTVRVGGADVAFASGAKISLAGQRIPGASLKLSDNVTATAQFAYFVTPHVSMSLTVGLPPETNATGVGVLAPLGRLGSVRYGPAAALVNYNFTPLGRIMPWVGVGPTYMVVFSNKDAAIQHLNVDSHWGAAVQAGAEYRFDRRWGLYASASKLFLHTDGSGTFSGLPIKAKIDLNPFVFQSGVTFHFR